ncbi:hypothetical protein LIA77_00710 [Sarocladium implicatum]|nr:hypothetical protein LIA77_00710 [Sarocladium implicatum]
MPRYACRSNKTNHVTLLHDRGPASARNEKKTKLNPRLSDVHRHPPSPRARRQDRKTGSRSSRVENNSLYSEPEPGGTRTPPPLRAGREDQKVFTLGRRGYTLINQGGFCGFFESQENGTNTIEMILLQRVVSNLMALRGIVGEASAAR